VASESLILLSDDDAQGNDSEIRGRAGLTDAEVDDELEALAATFANDTAEQAKQEAAAENSPDVAEFMKQLLDDGSRDSSSSGAMVTAADAARKRRADEATAIKQRAARRKSFRQAAGRLIPSDSGRVGPAASPPICAFR
jgi:hypothetical protein